MPKPGDHRPPRNDDRGPRGGDDSGAQNIEEAEGGGEARRPTTSR